MLGRVWVYGDADFSGGDFVFGDPFAAFFDALVEVRHPLVAFLCEGFYAVTQGGEEFRRVSVFPRRSKTTWQMHSSMRMATALFSAIDNTYMAVPALSCGECSRADMLMREGKKTQFWENWGLTGWNSGVICGRTEECRWQDGVLCGVRWRLKATLAARNGGRANNVTA